jgi:hypothetical protein
MDARVVTGGAGGIRYARAIAYGQRDAALAASVSIGSWTVSAIFAPAKHATHHQARDCPTTTHYG